MAHEDEVLLRRKEVEKMVGLSRTTIYDRIAAGTFPAPIKCGERAVRWKRSSLLAFIASLEKATEQMAQTAGAR